MILFLCNAGDKIGFGHLMRCRTLAQVLNEKKIKCVMIGPNLKFKEDGDIQLFQDWIPLENWDQDNLAFEKINQISDQFNSKVLVIDDYRANNNFQMLLKKAGFQWLQFDSSLDKPLWATWLINPSPEKFSRDYLDDVKNDKLKFFAGAQYSVLRKCFQNIPQKIIKKNIDNILITFGAGDDLGAIEFVLNALALEKYNIHIISGSHNPRNQNILDLIKSKKLMNVFLHINPKNIEEIFQKCDLAIISGGTTSFEVAACGIPFLIMTIASNQIRQAQAWNDCGVAEYVGEFQKISRDNFQRKLLELINNLELRQKMSKEAQKLVDGKGAQRLLEILTNDGGIK